MSTVIPPYLELDCNDKATQDLSSFFTVESTESFSELRKYFSRISLQKEDGSIWCSIILAQSFSFATFTDKARTSLENNSFSLLPEASDHESASEKGWLLYSTHQQDEARLSELFSTLAGESIGVKWRPI
jgi:hypothetical protein